MSAWMKSRQSRNHDEPAHLYLRSVSQCFLLPLFPGLQPTEHQVLSVLRLVQVTLAAIHLLCLQKKHRMRNRFPKSLAV